MIGSPGMPANIAGPRLPLRLVYGLGGVALAAVIVWSAIGLDYSGLQTFNAELACNTLEGLLHPDWSFVYDGSGEDLLGLLFVTLAIAALGTFIAAAVAIPLSFISSKSMCNRNIVSRMGKLVCNVLRAFPELIYAIIFVKVVGPGPFAGALAIGVHQIGMLGKLYTEQIEAMDETSVEAIRAVGGNYLQVLFFARIPQLLSIFSSYALNHFEIAVRSAATLGLVGAGGIGAPLIFAIQGRSWPTVSIILLGVIATVVFIDLLSGAIRRRLR